ncbi:hypothetical protein [Capillimicrobium parvum]|uniref:Uncharacterized protein n=1 Tax=Capillimicrobium parvum TaxID=2884022 RepID=A0A9E6XSD7_9ACTN|nr:hypothetical protein [Capillimicrobium parvum]UGS33866.1 hypothetical protein DSM104329_00231 [Capillimicrobium parvum]
MNVPNFMRELNPSMVSSDGTPTAVAAVIYTNLLKLDLGDGGSLLRPQHLPQG